MKARAGHLSDVLLGNNPAPTGNTGWSRLSERQYDLMTWDYGDGDWSVACNQAHIGPGTVGWIYRSDGRFGHLAGLIVFYGKAETVAEPGGRVDYFSDRLCRLPREWWVDGARIANGGWPERRSPFGARATRRFRNGERLSDDERSV